MLVFSGVALAAEFHAVRLVDEAGRPYPCATLSTVNHVSFETDADGVAAVHEPGLVGHDVWLEPDGPFAVPPDWLGLEGVRITLAEGGETDLVLPRTGPDPACDAADEQRRLLAHGVPEPGELHELVVVDRETGLPVPAVRLSVGDREWWTDNGGRVAWFDLDRMDETVRFDVWTHGYVHPDGFVEVVPGPGTRTIVEIDRVNLAERRVRLTGGGTWRDTVMLGLPVPAAEPLLSGMVVGQDTAHAVPWRGGLFWLWGDTNRPSYPLGNFHASGAFAPFDPTPEDGVDFDYLVGDDGFSRGIAPRFPSGPTWLGGLVALDDAEMWATFSNVDGDFVRLHEGMVRWDDATESFVEAFRWPEGQAAKAGGPAIRVGEQLMFRDLVRVPARSDALGDPAAYEAWTPLEPDGAGGHALAVDADGVPDWRWRTDAPAPDRDHVDLGLLPIDASPWHNTFDPDTGERVAVHQGTIAWNPWRGRWIHVFTQSFGASSLIGEIWYAEGDTPTGPWSWARKIVTHDGYSFYNPYLHPWFSSRESRRVLFEGTYTSWLGSQPPTPRHDYNQFFYALDLDDARLALPVPFYASADGPVPRHDATDDAEIAFGAMESPGDGRIPIRWTGPACAPDRALDPDGAGEIAFFALPAGTVGPGLADLVAWIGTDGTETWSTDDLSATGASAGPPIAAVWQTRWAPPVPLSQYPLPDRADAGPDRCGAASPVTLDARASVTTGGATGWTWRWEGGEAHGETADVDLPAGLHVVTLEVEGPSGVTTDTVVIEVAAGTDEELPGPDGEPAKEDAGCGCSTTGDGGIAGLLLLAGLVVRRRAHDRIPRRHGRATG